MEFLEDRFPDHLRHEEADRVLGDLVRGIQEGPGRENLLQSLADSFHSPGIQGTHWKRFTPQLL